MARSARRARHRRRRRPPSSAADAKTPDEINDGGCPLMLTHAELLAAWEQIDQLPCDTDWFVFARPDCMTRRLARGRHRHHGLVALRKSVWPVISRGRERAQRVNAGPGVYDRGCRDAAGVCIWAKAGIRYGEPPGRRPACGAARGLIAARHAAIRTGTNSRSTSCCVMAGPSRSQPCRSTMRVRWPFFTGRSFRASRLANRRSCVEMKS
jgi:hypothetical protein